MTSAMSMIVLIVAMIIGGVTGLVLGGSLDDFFVALAAGFLGVIGAAFVRNYVVAHIIQSGPDDSRIPGLIIVYSAVASLLGSMTALEIIQHVPELPHSLLGILAGLLSAALMIVLMVTYHMNPAKSGHRRHLSP